MDFYLDDNWRPRWVRIAPVHTGTMHVAHAEAMPEPDQGILRLGLQGRPRQAC